MKLNGAALFVLSAALASALLGQPFDQRARELEAEGNAAGARALLERTALDRPTDPGVLRFYSGFLDRHGDPQAREIYQKLLDLPDAGQSDKLEAARRLTALDLLAGDRTAAARHLEDFRTAGGTGLSDVSPVKQGSPETTWQYAEIPGPLESFARMSAISAQLDELDILPALGRNVMTSGYRSSSGAEGLEPTEFMKLLSRYLTQARELEQLADDSGNLVVETCDSRVTAELLRVLGYRMRGGCGSDVILETVNATRAFLTIDSGFPLADLEIALRTNRPFRYDYRPAKVPVLYGTDYWFVKGDKKQDGTFLDAFLSDPSLCRLYLALSKMEPDTVAALRQRSSLEQLKAFAHVLDFFGSLFEIRDGRAVVPGSTTVWGKLVGVSPDNGAEFFEKLIARDDGWLASYYDALRRIDGPVHDYLTDDDRLVRFYEAIRGKVTSPGPARPVFRANADLMLLTARLRLEPDGTPHIPGGLEVWRQLYIDDPQKSYDKKLKKNAPSWDDADDVLEAAFGLCRKPVDNEPLEIFMTLSDINRRRQTPLRPETVDRLARSWMDFGDQYSLFAETGALSDETILSFLDVAEGVNQTGNRLLRADAMGFLQSFAGLWQIFVRNGIVPESESDALLAGLLKLHGKTSTRQELLARALEGVDLLVKATGGSSASSLQDHFIGLLAGAASPKDVDSHRSLVSEMTRIFVAQKLIDLDTILETAKHLEAVAGGAQLDSALVNRLAAKLEEVQPDREGLSTQEKNVLVFGYWAERHLQRQGRLDVRRELRKAAGSPDEMLELRGELAFLLRDTLVGYNYLHYAPPGAQLLLTNPLFIRGHDFLGPAVETKDWAEAEVHGTGWPSSAGGRLVNSLAGLPYALAEAEQNFLIPSTEQALIWADLVPQMIVSSKVARWWNISPSLPHWTGLHLRLAQGAIAEGSLSPDRRLEILDVLRNKVTPARIKAISRLIETGDVPGALERVTPSELFTLGRATVEKEPDANVLSREIVRLAKADPDRVNYDAVSRAFGSPKPKLVHSYRPELLNLRTFPTLMGYSSRIMAETWESSLLYYAALSDELYLRPSELNVRVPQWTRQTVETIFATHLEDWPAVLRSLNAVGDQVRAAVRPPQGSVERASLDMR